MVETAGALGVRGWVRNRRDGSVEAVLIGSASALDELIERCWRGPAAARVKSVDTEDADDDGSAGMRQLATV